MSGKLTKAFWSRYETSSSAAASPMPGGENMEWSGFRCTFVKRSIRRRSISCISAPMGSECSRLLQITLEVEVDRPQRVHHRMVRACSPSGISTAHDCVGTWRLPVGEKVHQVSRPGCSCNPTDACLVGIGMQHDVRSNDAGVVDLGNDLLARRAGRRKAILKKSVK